VKIGEEAFFVVNKYGHITEDSDGFLMYAVKDKPNNRIVKNEDAYDPDNAPHRVVRVRLVEVEAPEPERNEQ
jgi:hypothetical protein